MNKPTRRQRRPVCPNRVFTKQELKEAFKGLKLSDIQLLEDFIKGHFGTFDSPYAGDFLAIFTVTQGKVLDYLRTRTEKVLWECFKSHGHFVLNDLTDIIEDKIDYIRRVGQIEWGIEIIQIKRALWKSKVATPHFSLAQEAFREVKEELEEQVKRLN